MIDWSYLNERYPADEWLREVHPLRESDYWVFMADALPMEYVRYVLLYLLKEGLVTVEEECAPELSIAVNIGPSDYRSVPQLYGAKARPFIVFNPTSSQEKRAFNGLGHNDVIALYTDEIGRIEGSVSKSLSLAEWPIRVPVSFLGYIEDEPIYVPPVKMDPRKLTYEELENLEVVAQRARARRATKEED